MIAVVAVLAVAAIAALCLGARNVPPADLWHSIVAFDPQNPLDVTIVDIRLPRILAGLIAGGALGMAGTVMQALTRNPLADPGLLGVGAGAAFAVVLGALLLSRSDAGVLAMLAFPGAGLAAIAVFALGGGLQGDMSVVRLTLAGAALNALLLSLVSAVVLIRADSLDVYRFWVVGSLAQAAERPLGGMGVVVLGAGALALAIAPKLETLSLGNSVARGLGTTLWQIQGGALLIVTLLTGAAVSVAGPIGFLGLTVPPLARRLVGNNLRAELFASAALGASILLLADTAGRLVMPPGEVRAGIMTALIGGPVFVWIARRLRGAHQ